MPHLRRHARSLAALAAVSVCAGALAAAAAAGATPPVGPAPRAVPLAGEAVVAWLPPDALVAAGETTAADGPYHPVRGGFRYGEQAGRYGAGRGGRMHEGQDMFAPAGTPLVAVRDGVVVETGNDGGRGNFIALYAPADRRTYVYLHMVAPTPHAVGARVRAGERVGGIGCTGSCWGDHLHFEVRAGRTAYGGSEDPLPLVQRWPQAPGR